MKHGSSLMKTFAGMMLAGWISGFSQPQDPVEEALRLKADIVRLKREIQHSDADLRRTDSLAREEANAAGKNMERWQRDRERREKENQELNGRVQQTRSKITAEQTRMRSYLNGVEEIKAHEKELLNRLSSIADSLLTCVQAGPPWDLETRRDRILSLKRDIEAGSAAPEEAFGRLAAILKEEIKNGDEIALFNRPMTRQNGEVVNAQLLKFGNQTLMYMDDEGKKFGVLEHHFENGKHVYVWGENLDFSEQNAVKLALAVKGGREAPQLIPLEFSLALDSASSKGGR